MDRELLRNGSGYVDPTAYKALSNYQKGESDMEYKRGEIFEYEMTSGRETKMALVVSADFRKNDRYINVILLTDEPKGQVNVPIVAGGGMMYADCGMVSFASNDRLGNYRRCATKAEMEKIDEGIAKCLGIESKTVEVPEAKAVEHPMPAAPVAQYADTFEELATARIEANVYKNLYEQLLAKMIG